MSESQKPSLGEFEGRVIAGTAIELPNASGGLNEAMKTEPRVIHQGDEGFLVLRYRCQKVRFQPMSADSELLSRVHVLQAGTAAFIDGSLVAETLERQDDLNRARLEREQGVAQLPIDQRNLRAEHYLGDHAGGLVENCPVCEEERELAEAEEAGSS